ncbi:cbb3-type cytochrome c oxidase subunit I [Actinocrinis puniceicyclus]|uniref:Cbb3-type cytochrome c oxidase subunit I n=1 Tax=Actinocrinis puniceicyclus TaxID=977794 RepID=A0A8J8BCJ7_9ACTN|nr:cbb3-type cytochrome c oxidase subunit I [Actinocrinis puniceicyclus]MBS2963595.1 cbb3-type cytochrome c oxidase subunit I [Actinocrinis puniceicyclus]
MALSEPATGDQFGTPASDRPPGAKQPRMIAKGWVQASILVTVAGFLVLGLLAMLTYQFQPPIPDRVVTPSGKVLFTGEQIRKGQETFLRNGLMEYGSIFGQGAYLGPDFTADYLNRAATSVQDQYSREGLRDPHGRTVADFRTNRYDEKSGTLVWTEAQAVAFQQIRTHYAELLGSPKGENGVRPSAITDPADIFDLTAYFGWTAWSAAADRPDTDYSYTNNWPSERLVDNVPTGHVVLWSVLSLIFLLAGAGAIFAAFGRWNFLGWHHRDHRELRFHAPDKVKLTPAQRATAGFFLAMAALFLVQTLVGALTEHYRADLSSFFGIPMDRWLPYNLTRTWHEQLAIFWVVTSFLAIGIFLTPLISRGWEPRRQALLTRVLLGALVVVVVGSLLGEMAGMRGWLGSLWKEFGDQGWAYIDLGKVWQVLLVVGLALWTFILFRGLRKRLRTESVANMPWLFFLAALALPAFYAVGLITNPDSEFTAGDFWRFIVVHLWVEDFMELFTTATVAYLFVLLGVVRERVALTVIYLDIVLYSAGGIIGTMHHLYFQGAPAEHLALGATFSALEVVPLLFLTVEAWSFLQLGARRRSGSSTPFPHRWAVMFLAAVGFWNFLGAGIDGFLINLPIVSYYEIGTGLTANHAHAAMMGVYGMLAVGFAVFALRYLIPEERWSDRWPRLSFWLLNIGLLWMSFASMLPQGALQLYKVVQSGYADARSLGYLQGNTNSFFEWLRLPGDVVFIAGVLPLLWMTWLGVRYRTKAVRSAADPEEVLLFTEIVQDDPAAGAEPDAEPVTA